MILGGSTALLIVVMVPVGGAMTKRGATIVDFELAGSRDRAQEILHRWEVEGRAAARRSLVLDYPFLVSYSLFLSVGAVLAGRTMKARGWRILARAAAPVAWGQLIAGGLDAIENASLLALLGGREDLPYATIATVCAVPKFVLALGLGVPYVVLGLVAMGRRRRGATPGRREKSPSRR